MAEDEPAQRRARRRWPATTAVARTGSGEALQLVDAFLRSEAAGEAVAVQPVEEIIAAVESIRGGHLRGAGQGRREPLSLTAQPC